MPMTMPLALALACAVAAGGEGLDVRGHVRDVTGAPVVATLRLEASAATAAATDAQGRFALTLPEGGGVVIAQAAGFLDARVEVRSASADLEVVLRPAGP